MLTNVTNHSTSGNEQPQPPQRGGRKFGISRVLPDLGLARLSAVIDLELALINQLLYHRLQYFLKALNLLFEPHLLYQYRLRKF